MQKRLRQRQPRKRTGRKDSEARRIEELFKSAAQAKKRSNPLANFVGGNEVPKGDSFNNPAAWDTFARGALRLEDTDFIAAAMRAAFETFKLDPVDPYSWRILVSCFAFIFFAEYPHKKVGAPGTPQEELKELLIEFNQLMIQNPELSKRKAALLLACKKTIGQEALRKRLSKAMRIKSD